MVTPSNSRVLPRVPLLILACLLSAPAEAQYGGGTGGPNDPYLIYTAEQMNAIGANPSDWSKHFRLMADIDLKSLTGEQFNLIGVWARPFSGVFDGNDHTISNFTYTSTDADDIGLFAYLGSWIQIGSSVNCEIRNLGLINAHADAGTGSNVGALVGQFKNGTITGCYSEDASVSGNWRVGGLVGFNGHGTITASYATGTVSGDEYVGGLVGHNYHEFEEYGRISESYSTCRVSGNENVGGLAGENLGSITACYSTSTVDGSGSVGGLVGNNKNDWYGESGSITASYSAGEVNGTGSVGGLVGNNQWRSHIVGSYSTAEVTANGYFVGGLVGNNYGAISTSCSSGAVTGGNAVGGLVGWNEVGAAVTGCYSTGSVTGGGNTGGLVGMIGGIGPITNSFWDTETSGQTESEGGEGKTTAEMKAEGTFTDAGWDFVGENTNGIEDIWSICEGTNYPRLAALIPAGDLACPDGISIEDFVFFVERLGDEDCDPNNDYCRGADFDLSGSVDANDLVVLVEIWLQSQPTETPAPAPPEPPEPTPPPGPQPPKGRSCFPAGTPVWINGTLVRISDVTRGQIIGELRSDSARHSLARIETVEQHEGTFECRDITLESGNSISVVDAHCFMLDSGYWIAAQNLRSGQRLKTLSGTVGIRSVVTRARPFVGSVYNLKIENSNKYLVGRDAVIVRDY